MEINQQIIKTNHNMITHRNTFEPFINSFPNGEEYYWQHLTDLQQSALNFNKKLSNWSTTANKIQELHHPSYRVPSPHVWGEGKKGEKRFISAPEESFYKSSNNPVQGPRYTTCSQDLEIPIEGKVNRFNKDQRKNQQQVSERRAVSCQTTPFKNHHLYLNDKTAELAIKITELTKNQTQELRQHIKQWLINKSLILKQLIINGEQA